jgi:hypothetical protein
MPYNQKRTLLSVSLVFLLSACSDNGGTTPPTGSDSGPAPGSDASTPIVSPLSTLTPDDGVRLTCAAIPRIGQEGGTYYLYHNTELASETGRQYATSTDALSFGSPKKSVQENVNGKLFAVLTGSPGRQKLPSPSARTTPCMNPTHRVYTHNGALQGFGTGITANCSTDGERFASEGVDLITSEEGGQMGVVTSYALGGRVHVLTMDGMNDHHRIWHYKSTDGTGDSFTLVSNDPLGNGDMKGGNIRHNDPFAYAMDDGSFLVLTMRMHGGNINPPNTRTGEIHAWRASAANGDSVVGENLVAGENEALIDVDDFVAAGHDVYSVNDPSVIKLADGRYRVYVGALLKAASYPSEDLSGCIAKNIKEDGYAWAILSATSQ